MCVDGRIQDLAVFLSASFGPAALLDVWFLSVRGDGTDRVAFSIYGTVWGLLRIYVPTAGALLAIKASGERGGGAEGVSGAWETCLGLLLAGASRRVSGCGHISVPGAGRRSRGPGEPVQVIVEETKQAVRLRLSGDYARFALVVQILLPMSMPCI